MKDVGINADDILTIIGSTLETIVLNNAEGIVKDEVLMVWTPHKRGYVTYVNDVAGNIVEIKGTIGGSGFMSEPLPVGSMVLRSSMSQKMVLAYYAESFNHKLHSIMAEHGIDGYDLPNRKEPYKDYA